MALGVLKYCGPACKNYKTFEVSVVHHNIVFEQSNIFYLDKCWPLKNADQCCLEASTQKVAGTGDNTGI